MKRIQRSMYDNARVFLMNFNIMCTETYNRFVTDEFHRRRRRNVFTLELVCFVFRTYVGTRGFGKNQFFPMKNDFNCQAEYMQSFRQFPNDYIPRVVLQRHA